MFREIDFENPVYKCDLEKTQFGAMEINIPNEVIVRIGLMKAS